MTVLTGPLHDARRDQTPLAATTDPRTYAERPEAVELVEAHASRVFLAGSRAYKVKKPVTLSFLDYGTLEKRRALCREETRLNRLLVDAYRKAGGDPGDDPVLSAFACFRALVRAKVAAVRARQYATDPQRAAARAARPGSLSDATPDIVRRLLDAWESFAKIPATRRLVVPADRMPADVVDAVPAWLDRLVADRHLGAATAHPEGGSGW